MKDENFTNATFFQFNQWPGIDSYLTAKVYVDNFMDEPSLVRNNQDNDFNNLNLTNKNGITLNTQAVYDNQMITKAFVDQYHQKNERSKRDLGLDFFDESSDLVRNNQDNGFNDGKLTIIDSITVNRNPTLYYEFENKKFVDDSIERGTIVGFKQAMQNYSTVSCENDTDIISKYDKIQITYVTENKSPNTGSGLLQK